MNIKTLIKISLILALATVPMTGFAQDEGSATSVGEPGPWIYTFFGVPFAAPLPGAFVSPPP